MPDQITEQPAEQSAEQAAQTAEQPAEQPAEQSAEQAAQTAEQPAEQPAEHQALVTFVQSILATNVNKVATNGNVKRFYLDDISEQNWDYKHHLVSLDDSAPDYVTLVLNQFSNRTDEHTATVSMAMNEVDELLAILLQWRMECENIDHPGQPPAPLDDGLGDLDDHPF
jgi:hypothetical protein